MFNQISLEYNLHPCCQKKCVLHFWIFTLSWTVLGLYIWTPSINTNTMSCALYRTNLSFQICFYLFFIFCKAICSEYSTSHLGHDWKFCFSNKYKYFCNFIWNETFQRKRTKTYTPSVQKYSAFPLNSMSRNTVRTPELMYWFDLNIH